MLHIIKLSVGTKSIANLAAWQKNPMIQIQGHPSHITRMWPKRAAEILNGGSIYWVIQGQIQVRQRIIDFHEIIPTDGKRQCAFLLDPNLIPVATTPRRPFQGWRYLEADTAPPDLSNTKNAAEDIPAALKTQLADIGII